MPSSTGRPPLVRVQNVNSRRPLASQQTATSPRARSPQNRDGDQPSQRRRLHGVRDRTPPPQSDEQPATSPAYSPEPPRYDPLSPSYTLPSTSPLNYSPTTPPSSDTSALWPFFPSRYSPTSPSYSPADPQSAHDHPRGSTASPIIAAIDSRAGFPPGHAQAMSPPLRQPGPSNASAPDPDAWRDCPVHAASREVSTQFIAQLRRNLADHLRHPAFSSTPQGIHNAYEAAAAAVIADIAVPRPRAAPPAASGPARASDPPPAQPPLSNTSTANVLEPAERLDPQTGELQRVPSAVLRHPEAQPPTGAAQQLAATAADLAALARHTRQPQSGRRHIYRVPGWPAADQSGLPQHMHAEQPHTGCTSAAAGTSRVYSPTVTLMR